MITTYTDKTGRHWGMFGKPHTVMAGPRGKVRIDRPKMPTAPETHRSYCCISPHRQCVGWTNELEEALVFLQTGLSPRAQRRRKITIVLTPTTWSLFERKKMDSDNSPLQPCCGNISDLRDAILAIRENKGVMTPQLKANLAMHWGFCVDGHGFDDVKWPQIKPLRSLIEQAGLEWPVPDAQG